MRTRTLGKTCLRVSEIGFGGWAIGGNAFGNSYGDTDDAVSKAALRRALELGVTLFDTADLYGFGHSEALLGEVLLGWAGQPPTVVTKGGVNFYRRDETLEPDWTPYAVAHAVQQSLLRLRRDALDVFLLMNPPVEELDRWRTWETLDSLKRSGKISHFGVSVAEPEDGVWLLRHNKPVEVIEVAYSLFYQGATVELLDLARKRKVGILAREPLANGFLTGKYTPDAQFTEGDIRASLPPEYVQAMTETAAHLQFLTRGGERTMPQAALRFVLDDPRVTSVVVGAKTPAQLEENIGAASVPNIDGNEREQIQKVFEI
jgi:aryl-alcohol dehydrogenase-like predicted oxidoreductase